MCNYVGLIALFLVCGAVVFFLCGVCEVIIDVNAEGTAKIIDVIVDSRDLRNYI